MNIFLVDTFFRVMSKRKCQFQTIGKEIHTFSDIPPEIPIPTQLQERHRKRDHQLKTITNPLILTGHRVFLCIWPEIP